jgi:hypothetical protein
MPPFTRSRWEIELLALARPYASQGLSVRSFRRDGAIFNAFSHHFVVGYYQMSLRD